MDYSGNLLAVYDNTQSPPEIEPDKRCFMCNRKGWSSILTWSATAIIISHSKSDPEDFLKAAEYLHLSPEVCLVVEDAVSGVQASHAGGFLVAAVGDASAAGAGDYNMEVA